MDIQQLFRTVRVDVIEYVQSVKDALGQTSFSVPPLL